MASPVTFSYEAEWGAVLGSKGVEFTADRRSTTSSRRPGAKIEGTVMRRTLRIAPCVKCHGLRYDLGGPHAPRVTARGLVDCVGDGVAHG